MPPRRSSRSLIGALILAAALAGCGTAARSVTHSVGARQVATTATTSAQEASAHTEAPPTEATICTASAEAVVRRMLGAPPSARPSMANTGYPQCDLRVRRRGGRVVDVVAEVDTEPSAYAVLERTIVEASQIWPARLQSAPVHVGGLGIDASWFSMEQHLMTTDAVRLITVGVTWRHARRAEKIALTRAVARTYLGRPQPRLARGPAP